MPKIFISYSSRDRDFVERLATDLKSKNIDIWYDAWEMKVGDSLTRKIQEGIKASSFLAVVLSPNSTNSTWVQTELRAAMSKEIHSNSVFILPILYRECEIPEFLRDKIYADFRVDYSKGIDYLLWSIAGSATTFKDDDLLGKITDSIIIEYLANMTLKQAEDLVVKLEERFGVSRVHDEK